MDDRREPMASEMDFYSTDQEFQMEFSMWRKVFGFAVNEYE